MNKITVLTASDHTYKDIVQKNIENCKKFGHKIVVYDLGELGFGIKKETSENDFNIHQGTKIKQISFKPEVIFETIKENENVMWVDGDAYVNRKIDFPFDFDLGFTARQSIHRDRDVKFINSGVIMINSNTNTCEFVKEWLKNRKPTDQRFINDKICQYISEDTKFEDREMKPLSFESTIMCDGKPRVLRIKIFPAAKYNDYYSLEEDSYVHHFKGVYTKSQGGKWMFKKYKEVLK